MCGECLSGRITAWRTILPAIIKARQVPFSSSVWLPPKYFTVLKSHAALCSAAWSHNNESLPAAVKSAGSSHRRWCHPQCLPLSHAHALRVKVTNNQHWGRVTKGLLPLSDQSCRERTHPEHKPPCSSGCPVQRRERRQLVRTKLLSEMIVSDMKRGLLVATNQQKMFG